MLRRKSRRGHSPDPAGDGFKPLFWVLAGLMVAMATIGLPSEGLWLGAKALLLEIVAIVVALVVVSNGEWGRDRVHAALRAAPNVAIMAFLAWVALSAALAPQPLQRFSSYEAMRHLGGGLFYFCIVYGPSVRRNLSNYALILAITGTLAAITSLLSVTNFTEATVVGAYRNMQLLAGVQCLLLPLVVMAAREDEHEGRRYAALGATIMIGIAILVAQNRSVRAAAAVGLIFVGILYGRFVLRGRSGSFNVSQIVVPLVVLIVAGGAFFAMSNQASGIGERIKTMEALQDDKSHKWRDGMRSKALRMTARKPLLGWGVGTFPVNQALFFHPDVAHKRRDQKEIVEQGPSLSENAHNTYFQIMAELGIPGVLLYLSIFAAWFATAFRSLTGLKDNFRKSILIGCIGAIVGQMISAFGNPSWEFPECSLFLWTVLGLGMAITGLGTHGSRSSRRRPAEDDEDSDAHPEPAPI